MGAALSGTRWSLVKGDGTISGFRHPGNIHFSGTSHSPLAPDLVMATIPIERACFIPGPWVDLLKCRAFPAKKTGCTFSQGQ